MKTALLQMDVAFGNREANKEKVVSLMEKTMDEHPDTDLFVLPELWTYPFLFKEGAPDIKGQLLEYGEELNGETVEFIGDLAAKYQVFIVAGSLPIHKADGSYGNTTLVFNREGKILDSYSKVHLCGWCGEPGAFQNGTEVKVIDTEVGKMAPIICYDIRFPELARTGALKGANLLVVSSDFGHNPKKPKVDIWRTLLKARAIENMMFVVACDRCGVGPESSYFGHSLIIDPYGNVIAEGDETEGVIVGEIDYRLVDEARKEIPIFEDRRPKVYQDSFK